MIQTSTLPGWMVESARTILNFDALPPNWNSYGAPPIQQDTIFAAIHLLRQIVSSDTPQPAVVPTTRGGVQVEWHQGGIDLEIKVISSQRFSMSFEDLRAGLAWEDEFDLNDLGRARSAVEALSDRT